VVANLEGDFLSYFNLGYVLLELERYDEGLAAFQTCLTLEAQDPATHYEISLIHFIRGEYQQALDQLQIPLCAYPEDWEVHNLIGRCQMRIGAYDKALTAFGNALRLAPRPSAQAEVIEHICTVERYREISTPRWVKDQLYADHGVVYLGSAQDDGIRVRETQDYHFTYPDIGITIRRFLMLCAGCDWNFTCVVALDRLARPLSEALGQLLNIPQRYADDVAPTDLPLLVLAIGREAELLELALERIPGESVTLCLGLNWLRHNSSLPDITGIIARGACSVPWEPELRRLRSDGAPQAQVEECLRHATHQIVTATADVPVEANLARQIRYYARRHKRLRFADVFDGITSVMM
jgi:tetratricopeptide (TPR) repeat protein